MPIYEYQCEECARIEEAIQRFSDPPLTLCSGCGGNLSKLISHSSFHLKGSGWYVTDYADKKSGTSPEAKTEGTGKDGSAGNDAPKSDAGSVSASESGTASSGSTDT